MGYFKFRVVVAVVDMKRELLSFFGLELKL
jgi:hypothetical protein